MKQSTINKTVKISGIGLFSGVEVNLELIPSDIDTGIVFSVKGHNILATYDNIINTDRRTIIGNDSIQIHTVEHLMAALYMKNITNIIVEMDNFEPPVLDGSSIGFIEAINKVGIKEQNDEILPIIINKRIEYGIPSKDSYIIALPYDGFKITYVTDYPSCDGIDDEEFTVDVLFGDSNNDIEIASARTYCLSTELLELSRKNFLKGASLDNGIVYVDNNINNEVEEELISRFDIDKNSFSNKIINKSGLRFDNEAARHKILDILGDFFLLGRPVKGHIIAHKTGHNENIELIKKIGKELKVSHDIKKYKYDINQILEILHHRYPFLLIDEITELIPNKTVKAIKNVTFNEHYFQGHFPGKAIMPGVLIVEAMAQSGGFLLLHTVKDPSKQLVIFSRVNFAKFRKMVVPGDTVLFETELVSLKMNTCKLYSKATVNNDIVAESEFMATIIDKDF